MKKLSLYVSVLVVLMMLSGSLYGQLAQRDWTFMVYMAADNNLEPYAIDDFLEMAQVGSDANINIIVQFDRRAGYSSEYGDWTSTKRFRVTRNMTPTAANQISDLGEINMGNPNNLVNFVNWAKQNYPATNYALILWDHGDGWRKAQEAMNSGKSLEELIRATRPDVFRSVCGDDTNNGDYLHMLEIKNAMNTFNGVDLIGFDACLMGMVEVAYMVKDDADVMVGSEENEPGNGWPYHTLLADLAANPNMTPAQLGTAICNRYIVASANNSTQSCIDLTQVDALETSLDAFSTTMINNWNDVDKTAVVNAAQAVLDDIDTAVIHERHNNGAGNSYGLAIYFPGTAGQMSGSYNNTNVHLARDSQWDEFLNAFHNNMDNTWVDQIHSNLQRYAAAYGYQHYDLYDFCNRIVDMHGGNQGNPPAAPSGLTLTARKSKHKVVIKWTDNSNNETGFKIYRGTSASNLSLIKTKSANIVKHVDKNLTAGTVYYYKVCAYNNDGETCTSVKSVTAK